MINQGIKISHLAVLAIGAILIFGLAFSYGVATSQDSRMRKELLTLARTAMNAVDMERVMQLRGSSADLDTPDYRHIKSQLSQMRFANPKCRFIYLMGRRTDGMVYFFVDSEPADSEDYSPPGQTYDEASATLHQVFATGKETTDGPATDRWGTWVSAHIPLVNPDTEEVVAVLGMDVDSRDWWRLVALHSAAPVSITLLLVALLAVLFILYQRAEREKQLIATYNEQLQAQLGENLLLQDALREQAVRDPLTGLFNRRYLEETLERELSRAGREHSPLSLAILDIDHFKRLNDTYGHEAGDAVLRSVASLLNNHVRTEDIVCRHGGEEFVVVLPATSLENAMLRLEQLRSVIEASRVRYQQAELRTTVSIGLAAFPLHGKTSRQVLQIADRALYDAKGAGRNRIMIYERTGPEIKITR